MLNFNESNTNVHPITDSTGAGIIMDVDLEQLIRESERLRVCEAIFCRAGRYSAYEMLEPVLAGPNIAHTENASLDPRVPPEEANHA